MSARTTMLECCLWSLAYWGNGRGSVGLLGTVWRASGEHLIDRLTIDEVWLARKRLLERLN